MPRDVERPPQPVSQPSTGPTHLLELAAHVVGEVEPPLQRALVVGRQGEEVQRPWAPLR
jgi:hypothetical protein